MDWLYCWELGKKGRRRRLREREEGGGLLCVALEWGGIIRERGNGMDWKL